ncbi:MAG: hypothetical protein HY925_06730, partial [Elusimicrobia bacterium]|nr:hypothetical protein [Elusimicrobiota bacterium]
MRRLFLIFSALLFSACSPRTMALRAAVPVLEKGTLAFYEEADPVLARESFPAQLKTVEALLKSDPENKRLKLMLAEGFGGYAFLFLEDNEPDRAKGLYKRGRDYALQTLRAPLRDLPNLTLDDALKAVDAATPDDLAGLFWAGYGWGGWINLSKDAPEAVADLPKVVAIMEKVNKLSPGYYYGGAELFLGSYDAARPRMLGGDPAKAKARFEQAAASTEGKFLVAKVLYAQYYAVATQDAELFKKLLDEVVEFQDDVPRSRLANAVAKQKA